MFTLPVKNYIIVGSSALGTRAANDLDIICLKKDILTNASIKDDYIASFMFKGKRVECLLADNQSSLRLMLQWAVDNSDLKNNPLYSELTPIPILYGLKAGHIMIPSKKWEIHMTDYQILKSRGADKAQVRIGNFYYTGEDLAKEHTKSTKERLQHKARTPKLKGVRKDEFFDDLVKKYVEHDTIHEWMAHRERPMFTYMQENPDIVECSKDLFDKFPRIDKIKCVLEEAYTIALERHVIPTIMGDKIGLSPKDALKWAIMRICTNLCSGWFRKFAIDNYPSIINSANLDYYKILDSKKHLLKRL